MGFTISKSFTFEAAHRLPLVPPEHPCSRPHGHNYRVTLLLGSPDLRDGMVVDYNDMKSFKRWVDARLDHRDLNDLIENPTAEVIAWWIYHNMPQDKWFKYLYGVEVNETDKTSATYYATDGEPVISNSEIFWP